jgi:hypothetical protein
MLLIFMAAVLLVGLGLAGVYVGVRIAHVLGEQFDELMPERMVEYSGFVQFPLGRD